jgi:hypothetical protein
MRQFRYPKARESRRGRRLQVGADCFSVSAFFIQASSGTYARSSQTSTLPYDLTILSLCVRPPVGLRIVNAHFDMAQSANSPRGAALDVKGYPWPSQ